MPHKYTDEEREFIANNVKGIGNKQLTKLFNKNFGLNLGANQIKAYKKNHHLSSGLDGRFEKGQDAWNKGLKGLTTGGEETQFKKGDKAPNWVPIGSERVNTEGYVEIKVQDGNRFKCDIDNLILVSRKQLLMLNRNNLIQKDADLTRTGVIIADLYQKINDRKK